MIKLYIETSFTNSPCSTQLTANSWEVVQVTTLPTDNGIRDQQARPVT